MNKLLLTCLAFEYPWLPCSSCFISFIHYAQRGNPFPLEIDTDSNDANRRQGLHHPDFVVSADDPGGLRGRRRGVATSLPCCCRRPPKSRASRSWTAFVCLIFSVGQRASFVWFFFLLFFFLLFSRSWGVGRFYMIDIEQKQLEWMTDDGHMSKLGGWPSCLCGSPLFTFIWKHTSRIPCTRRTQLCLRLERSHRKISKNTHITEPYNVDGRYRM